MDVWNRIVNSLTKAFYTDVVIQFRKVWEKYLDLLKYVESTILDKVKEKVELAHASLKNWLGNRKGDLCQDWNSVNLMVKNQLNKIQIKFGRSITVLEHRFKDNILYSQLVGKMSRFGLNYIFYEAKRGETVGSDCAKCGCTISKTYGLSCACVIAKNMKLGEPIRMDEISPHCKRLSIDYDDGCMEGGKSDISIPTELKVIQEIFSKADNSMKIRINEQLRKIGYLETTDIKPPSQSVKTKGAPKKIKPTPNDNSTTLFPSYAEHVDKLFPNSPNPKSRKSFMKGACISKPPPTPILPKIPFIDEMSVFMPNNIERIFNVEGDGNWGYQAVSNFLGEGEDSHALVFHKLI
ncbi:uncharacterized protein LOC131598339 [Vicia villosa]|uniref:uncharacterized protein LOC131598339 n=1 Tax=Vicia villosa TaxID=3911 RepID=UPI00273B3BAC|nr:uncharacterized protein LOC131598339 [Vicia villosa]